MLRMATVQFLALNGVAMLFCVRIDDVLLSQHAPHNGVMH
jgi:hypothetical protein